MAKITGKAGSFSYATNVLTITKWEAKVNRGLADSTGSDNYDATTDMVHMSQLPATLQTEFTVEGRFDTSTTQSQLIVSLYAGTAAVAAIFKISAAVTFGHGTVDISDFSVTNEITGTDAVSWTCTAKTNGVFTMGS